MRGYWLSIVPIACAITCAGAKEAQTHCEPGSEIFCRCRGGDPGTKLCAEDGTGFGECRLADGECTEIPEPDPDSATTHVGAGGFTASSVGSGGGPPGAGCAHDLCEAGLALDPTCDACVNKLCTGIDPYCCDLLPGESGSWDEMCIGEVKTACGIDCAGSSSTTSSQSSGPASSSSGGNNCFSVSLLIPGDLVISEIMNDPSSLVDTQGEWFEVYNGQNACIDMKGMTIESMNDPSYVITTSVIVEAGGYAVFGRDKATLAGIGVELVHSYGASLALGNGSDSITLKAHSTVVDTTSYNGTGLNPVGATRSLDPNKLDASLNDDNSAFCEAKSFIQGSSGDRGTPGKANDFCN